MVARFAQRFAVMVMAVSLVVCAAATVHAQSGGGNAQTAAQIERIAEDQEKILADLADIKEKLRILTIRVTQAQ